MVIFMQKDYCGGGEGVVWSFSCRRTVVVGVRGLCDHFHAEGLLWKARSAKSCSFCFALKGIQLLPVVCFDPSRLLHLSVASRSSSAILPDHSSVFQTADDIQWYMSHAQPDSRLS